MYATITEKTEHKIIRHMELRVSDATEELLENRTMKRIISRIYRLIRWKLKEDIEDYKHRTVITATERKQSLKKNRRELLLCHPILAALKSEDGHRVMDRTGTEEICRKYCTKQFAMVFDSFAATKDDVFNQVPMNLVK